jgi:hypothetical protein
MMPPLHFGFVAVRFRDELTHAQRRRVAGDCHLGSYPDRFELPGESFTLFPVAEGQGSHRHRHGRAFDALGCHPHVVHAAPVVRHGRLRGLATDRIWVAFRSGGDRVLSGLVHRGARVLYHGDDEVLVRLPAGLDPAAECRRLGRLRSVAWAEPDQVLIGRRFAAARGGSSAPVQPAMRQIRADRAWQLQPGQRTMMVAILDCGVLASHPDLKGTVVARYDATGQGNPLRPHPWDSHGTECAALIVGRGASRQGIRGVASGCGLAVVRVGFTPSRMGDYVTKASWLHRGIEWAWRHGASVLSMSFGGGPPLRPVAAALDRAARLGRRGKGCVLVAAAGNDGTSPVEFPSSVPGVIAVGATTPSDRPASFSNRGRAVALAAPGVNIRTATIPDPEIEEPDKYITDSGTSLAAPLVSGAAALVLCAEPSLTAAAVRRRLCGTATRPRGVRFVRGRNNRVGAGRLDVAAAVEGKR